MEQYTSKFSPSAAVTPSQMTSDSDPSLSSASPELFDELRHRIVDQLGPQFLQYVDLASSNADSMIFAPPPRRGDLVCFMNLPIPSNSGLPYHPTGGEIPDQHFVQIRLCGIIAGNRFSVDGYPDVITSRPFVLVDFTHDREVGLVIGVEPIQEQSGDVILGHSCTGRIRNQLHHQAALCLGIRCTHWRNVFRTNLRYSSLVSIFSTIVSETLNSRDYFFKCSAEFLVEFFLILLQPFLQQTLLLVGCLAIGHPQPLPPQSRLRARRMLSSVASAMASSICCRRDGLNSSISALNDSVT
jgi:hypothetical protein